MEFARIMRLTHEGRAEGFEGLTALAGTVFVDKTWSHGAASNLRQAITLLSGYAMRKNDPVYTTKIKHAITDCTGVIIAECERLKDLPIHPDSFGIEKGVNGEDVRVRYGIDPRDEARSFCNVLGGMKDLLDVTPDTIEGNFSEVEFRLPPP